MKNKLGKIISISFLAIGYFSCILWGIIELARYYGWQSFFNNSLFSFFFNLYNGFSKNGIAWFFTYLVSFSLVIAFGIFSIKCIRERRLAYYKRYRTEINLAKDASYYNKDYDSLDSISAYDINKSEIDLETQYDLLINK